jgi:hypothetical protein
MADELVFSDEPLDGVQQDFDSWEPAPEFAPPPPAGTYQVYLSEIREEKEFEGRQGKRLAATVDFRIIGGEYDDRAITWQRLSNAEFERRGDGKRTSLMLDLIRSAGVTVAPKSNNEFHKVMQSLLDRGKAAPLKVQVDWRGFCSGCYEKSLIRQTGAPNAAAAKEAAEKDNYDTANGEAVKAKSYRGFPLTESGSRQDSFICPDCGNEVRAQIRVSRYFV